MSPPQPPIPYTYDDYQALPESLDRRYELLGGEILMVPAPTTLHQQLLRNLGFALVAHTRAQGLGEVLYAPADEFWVRAIGARWRNRTSSSSPRAGARSSPPKEIAGAPDLVVEILSPGTEDRDRGYKRKMYARHGIREYWVVDPRVRSVEPYGRPGEVSAPPTRLTERDILASRVLPGLTLDLHEVFEPEAA